MSVAVAGRELVSASTIALPARTTTCVLGCNGAGKTLTLHTLAGLRAPARGTIQIDGTELSEWPRRALARRIGLLPQDSEDPFPSTVLETALIGRHPHLGFWQWESDVDRDIACSALAEVRVRKHSRSATLGLCRAANAGVLPSRPSYQDASLLLLDEPINHLDPHHQIDVLRLFQKRAQAGGTVIMSLHDAGLAARFADHALLLFGNGEWTFGATTDVLTEHSISRLDGSPGQATELGRRPHFRRLVAVRPTQWLRG